jgi:hypothetical protein
VPDPGGSPAVPSSVNYPDWKSATNSVHANKTFAGQEIWLTAGGTLIAGLANNLPAPTAVH